MSHSMLITMIINTTWMGKRLWLMSLYLDTIFWGMCCCYSYYVCAEEYQIEVLSLPLIPESLSTKLDVGKHGGSRCLHANWKKNSHGWSLLDYCLKSVAENAFPCVRELLQHVKLIRLHAFLSHWDMPDMPKKDYISVCPESLSVQIYFLR